MRKGKQTPSRIIHTIYPQSPSCLHEALIKQATKRQALWVIIAPTVVNLEEPLQMVERPGPVSCRKHVTQLSLGSTHCLSSALSDQSNRRKAGKAYGLWHFVGQIHFLCLGIFGNFLAPNESISLGWWCAAAMVVNANKVQFFWRAIVEYTFFPSSTHLQ